jgi:hypothetical protein
MKVSINFGRKRRVADISSKLTALYSSATQSEYCNQLTPYDCSILAQFRAGHNRLSCTSQPAQAGKLEHVHPWETVRVDRHLLLNYPRNRLVGRFEGQQESNGPTYGTFLVSGTAGNIL